MNIIEKVNENSSKKILFFTFIKVYFKNVLKKIHIDNY